MDYKQLLVASLLTFLDVQVVAKAALTTAMTVTVVMVSELLHQRVDSSCQLIIIIIFTRYYTTYNSLPPSAAMTGHRLSRRTATTTRFSPEGIGCQKQTALRFCQHVGLYLASIHQMAAPEHTSDKQACYSFIDERLMPS